MWIIVLTLRSKTAGIMETACYGPYSSKEAATDAARTFNLADWQASIHEVLPEPSEGRMAGISEDDLR